MDNGKLPPSDVIDAYENIVYRWALRVAKMVDEKNALQQAFDELQKRYTHLDDCHTRQAETIRELETIEVPNAD